MIGVVDEIEALFARSFKKFYKTFNFTVLSPNLIHPKI